MAFVGTVAVDDAGLRRLAQCLQMALLRFGGASLVAALWRIAREFAENGGMLVMVMEVGRLSCLR